VVQLEQRVECECLDNNYELNDLQPTLYGTLVHLETIQVKLVSDIAVFVLKRDVELQLTN